MTSPFVVLPRHQNDVPGIQNILRRLTASFLTLSMEVHGGVQLQVGGHAGGRAPSFWAPPSLDVSSGLILSLKCPLVRRGTNKQNTDRSYYDGVCSTFF